MSPPNEPAAALPDAAETMTGMKLWRKQGEPPGVWRGRPVLGARWRFGRGQERETYVLAGVSRDPRGIQLEYLSEAEYRARYRAEPPAPGSRALTPQRWCAIVFAVALVSLAAAIAVAAPLSGRAVAREFWLSAWIVFSALVAGGAAVARLGLGR